MGKEPRKLKCICCGFEKEAIIEGMGDYEPNGFSFLMDMSNGLTTKPVCMDCRKKADEHINALEEMFHIEYDCMYFPNHNN